MPLIEGIGDEVTQFFVLVLILLVGVIAWQSTGISDRQIIRTVLILERRTRHRALELPVTPPTATTSLESSIDTGQGESQPPNENQEDQAGVSCHICDKENTSAQAASSSSQSVSDPTWEFPEESLGDGDHPNTSESNTPSIEDTMFVPHAHDRDCINIEEDLTPQNEDSSESNILRRRRLAFFQNRQATLLESPVESRLDGPSTSDQHRQNNASQPEFTLDPPIGREEPPSPGNIRIRLKYLNDDQKLVEGRLQEQLGDFKRRHFGLELAGDKLVRLIFNGQVLQSDNDTLQDYGLFDNCVVHCLVHQQRSTSGPVPDASSGTRTTGAAEGIPQREWDLGNVLFASLSLMLGLAWYCRYQYAQLFNATTTVALVGLTGILTVSLVGIYLPDQDSVRH